MNKRSLGNTGFEVSEIGLGAWQIGADWGVDVPIKTCLLYTSPSPRDGLLSRMPSSA